MQSDEARRGDDFPRDRDRPLVVSDRVHAAGLDGRGDRRPPPLAQAALLRRAHRRPRLAHPDLRRAHAAPHDPDRHRRRQRQGAHRRASLEHARQSTYLDDLAARRRHARAGGLRPVHPPARGPRRLEHALAGRALGPDASRTRGTSSPARSGSSGSTRARRARRSRGASPTASCRWSRPGRPCSSTATSRSTSISASSRGPVTRRVTSASASPPRRAPPSSPATSCTGPCRSPSPSGRAASATTRRRRRATRRALRGATRGFRHADPGRALPAAGLHRPDGRRPPLRPGRVDGAGIRRGLVALSGRERGLAIEPGARGFELRGQAEQRRFVAVARRRAGRRRGSPPASARAAASSRAGR